MKKKVDELRQDKEQLIAQRAEASASWKNAQTRLKQIELEIADASQHVLSHEESSELRELESHRSRAEQVRQEIAILTAEQTALEASIKAVRELKSACPTCGRTLSDETKEKEIEARGERLRDIEALIQGAREELSEYAGLEGASMRLERHEKAIAQHAKLAEEQERLRRIKEPQDEQCNAKMAIPAERITKGERVLEKAQRAEACRAEWETSIRQKAHLEERIARLEVLIDFFGPAGAMISQVGSQLRSFHEELTRHFAKFGYTYDFSINPYKLHVSLDAGRESRLALEQLSESERFRFGIAFQIAVAHVVGLRFVVIDGADILDTARRKLLTSMLLCSDLDQAIVLGTGDQAPPRDVPAGVRFLDLAALPALAPTRS